MKFKLILSPQRRDDTLEIVKDGAKLTINGEEYDFSPLADGATLPAEAVGCEFIVGNVDRTGDTITLTVLLPNSATASEAARFPEPIIVETNGKVVLPE